MHVYITRHPQKVSFVQRAFNALEEPLIGHYLYRLAEGGWKHKKRTLEVPDDATAESSETERSVKKKRGCCWLLFVLQGKETMNWFGDLWK